MKYIVLLCVIFLSIVILFCKEGSCSEISRKDKNASQLGILDNLGSPFFKDSDFDQMIHVLKSLRAEKNPIACLLFEKLSPDMKKFVSEHEYGNNDSDSFKKTLIADINRIISGPCIYDKDGFAAVELFWHTKELLEKDLSGMDLVRLNRMLMEDALPSLLERYSQAESTPRFKGNRKARELLEKNGFVVVPSFEKQIFSIYVGSEFPVFITTDSIFAVFHRNLEESMKQVEKAQQQRLSQFLKKMISAMTVRYFSSDGLERQPLARSLAFFLVAARLNGDLPEISESVYAGSLKESVEAELQKIKEEKGASTSHMFSSSQNRLIDYSTFRPRGFYASDEKLAHYFSAITWLGSFPLRVSSDDETLSALIIVKVLMDNPELLGGYQDIEDINEFCWGKSDDLTVEEYLDAARKIWGSSIDFNDSAFNEKFGDFRSMIRKMRDPVISSITSTGKGDNFSKGLCLFGSRLLPDSWVFERLSHPAVPGKAFTQGIDIMSALGSARASTIIEKSRENVEGTAYAKAMDKAREGLGKELKATERDNIYSEYLRMTQRYLDDREIKDALPCTAADAWKDRKLNMAIASWAMMRHTWGLQARKKVTLIGSCIGEAGYVEPEIRFYSDLRKLCGKCRQKFQSLGLDTRHYEEIESVLGRLMSISEKELKRESMSDDDNAFLHQYGEEMGHLCFYENESYMCDLEEMALITDVASELQSGKVLYEGIGGAMEIYVIVNFREGPVLTRGGVLSYYEFTRSNEARLTDEEWKDMVSRRDTPDFPEWTSSFVACHDNDRIMEELKKGKVPEEAFSSRDERIVPFLMDTVCDDRVFSDVPEEGKSTTNREKAAYLLKDKGGRLAAPVLMKLLSDPDYKIRLNATWKLIRFNDPSLIPELMAIYESGKRPASSLALDIIGKIRCPGSKDIMTKALKDRRLMKGSPLIEPGEIEYPARILRCLIKPDDAFATFIVSQLSPSTRDMLAKCENSDHPTQALIKAIVGDLNRLITGPSIYQKDRFNGITLRKSTLEILNKGGDAGECNWLNRMLLQDAYRYAIHDCNDYRRIAFGNLIRIYRACELNDEFLSFLSEENDADKKRAIEAISFLWAGDAYIKDYLERGRRDSSVYQKGIDWVVEDGTLNGILQRWRYPTQWNREELASRSRAISLLMDIARTEKDSIVADEAFSALGCIGDERAMPLLIKMDRLYDLCQIGGPKVESFFIDRLNNQAVSHSREIEHTLDCLRKMKCRRAVPLMVKLLDDRTILQKESVNNDRLICDDALQALNEIVPESPQCDLDSSIPRGLRDVLIDNWKEWWKKEGKARVWK